MSAHFLWACRTAWAHTTLTVLPKKRHQVSSVLAWPPHQTHNFSGMKHHYNTRHRSFVFQPEKPLVVEAVISASIKTTQQQQMEEKKSNSYNNNINIFSKNKNPEKKQQSMGILSVLPNMWTLAPFSQLGRSGQWQVESISDITAHSKVGKRCHGNRYAYFIRCSRLVIIIISIIRVL